MSDPTYRETMRAHVHKQGAIKRIEIADAIGFVHPGLLSRTFANVDSAH